MLILDCILDTNADLMIGRAVLDCIFILNKLMFLLSGSTATHGSALVVTNGTGGAHPSSQCLDKVVAAQK